MPFLFRKAAHSTTISFKIELRSPPVPLVRSPSMPVVEALSRPRRHRQGPVAPHCMVEKNCQHQLEPDPAEQAQQHGAETSVLDWRRRLVCSKCGSREIDMIVTGTRRRG